MGWSHTAYKYNNKSVGYVNHNHVGGLVIRFCGKGLDCIVCMHADAYTSHKWVHNKIKWVTVKVSFLFYIDVASSKRNGTPGFMNVCSRNRPTREKLGEFHNLVKELYLPMETNLCCLSHSLRFFSTSSTPISFSFHDYTWKDGWKLAVDVTRIKTSYVNNGLLGPDIIIGGIQAKRSVWERFHRYR